MAIFGDSGLKAGMTGFCIISTFFRAYPEIYLAFCLEIRYNVNKSDAMHQFCWVGQGLFSCTAATIPVSQ